MRLRRRIFVLNRSMTQKMNDLQAGRVLHVTLHKCGSQWVRDVLCSPELAPHGALPNSGISLSLNVLATPELEIPDGCFAGPIYRMNRWEWLAWKRPGDRAIVVLRDPRDRLVSEIFSQLYSHGNDPFVAVERASMQNADHMQELIAKRIGSFGAILRCYVTWNGCLDDDVFYLRYEDLIDDQVEHFGRIVRWLGWSVPDSVVRDVVAGHSFETRTGRRRGEDDIYSHHRKGVAGDWRNHFLRSHGEAWERMFPGVLRSIGYADSDDWWRALPERIAPTEGAVR